MSPKRSRPNSLSSSPPSTKKQPHPASGSAFNIREPLPDPGDHATRSKKDLGMVYVSDTSEDEAPTAPNTHVPVKKDVGPIYIIVSDDDENGGTKGGKSAVHPGEQRVLPPNERPTGGPPGPVTRHPLVGLDDALMGQTSAIHDLFQESVGDQSWKVKLAEIPEDAFWNQENFLATDYNRPIVIVAIGILEYANIIFGRQMLASFSVNIALMREADIVGKQRIFALANPYEREEPTADIRAFRAAADERARLVNVYKFTTSKRGRPCGINELLGGDIVRVVMRCSKVEDPETGRVSVDFKLKRLDLLVEMPRKGDVRG